MSSALILAVGQDSMILSSRSAILRSAGYVVETAASAKQAIDRFRERHFDLVVLCHSLPLEDRQLLVSLIRASGSEVPLLNIAPIAGPSTKDVADATVGSRPDELLDGVEKVLTKATVLSAVGDAIQKSRWI